MKKVIVACLLLFGLWILTSYELFDKQTFKDSKVTVGESWTLLQALSPHLSRDQYIVVGNKRYANVRGNPPCYVKVPHANAILFTTGKFYKPDMRFHFIDFDSGKELHIRGQSTFGTKIGVPADSPYKDYIADFSNDVLILVEEKGMGTRETRLDLAELRQNQNSK